jgi:hypothetical protein
MEEHEALRQALLKDLELQWQDHFHMRDQTWKTVNNTALLFLGIVGLEIKEVGDLVMVPAYVVVILTSYFGWCVARHHRRREQQKFAFISAYEERLGLSELKRPILEGERATVGVTGKIFTGRFIGIMHIAIGVVGLVLLIRRCASAP